jgi:D-alanine-D-alanine ligase-like ATP-grasp enzyme
MQKYHAAKLPDRPSIFLSKLIQRLAPKVGAKVFIEPRFRRAGQIIFKDGRKSYFRNTSLDLNTLGATEVAKDKGYADFFLKRLGYKTLGGKVFLSANFNATLHEHLGPHDALAYAKKIGYPVIAKPNSLSQGVLVVKCDSEKNLKDAIGRICRKDHVYLVQKFVETFDDYRIVVLDNEIISCYRRVPLSVVGDGASSLRELLKGKQDYFKKTGRDTRLNLQDFRILQNLKRHKLTYKNILPRDKTLFLLDNANLSSGGDSEDVTTNMHASFKKLAIQITRDMGLRLCGVDLFIKGDVRKPLHGNYKVIEINAAPGLDHYAASGAKQKKTVEDMYLKVLKAMGK